MNRVRTLVPALTGLLAALLFARPAAAATFNGHSVDGVRYHGSILNADYGLVDNVEIRFDGDRADVYLRGGGRLILILQSEDIADPHRIPADDLQRGIVWEINAKDLGRR